MHVQSSLTKQYGMNVNLHKVFGSSFFAEMLRNPTCIKQPEKKSLNIFQRDRERKQLQNLIKRQIMLAEN